MPRSMWFHVLMGTAALTGFCGVALLLVEEHLLGFMGIGAAVCFYVQSGRYSNSPSNNNNRR